MKVVFDAYWWTSGPPSLRHVLREIVFAWHRVFPDDELTLVVRQPAKDVPDDVTTVTSALRPQALLATRAVASVARSIDADLVVSHNFAPRLASGLSTIYLHDVLFATNPEWFTRLERAYFSRMIRWAPRADIVFTSSRVEADRISEHTAARTVLPVGLGLSTELVATGERDDPDETVRPGHFVLTVGRLNARKNLGTVIRGALATGLVHRERPLLIVGSANGRGERFDRATQRAVDEGAVRFTGFVDEARLRWYYRHASLFVYLSLGEGFGMPPVEAAYFSAQILVSDLPVFRETLGAAADYVDPTDHDAVRTAMRDAIVRGEQRMPDRRPRGGIAATHDWNATVSSMRDAVVERQSVGV